MPIRPPDDVVTLGIEGVFADEPESKLSQTVLTGA